MRKEYCYGKRETLGAVENAGDGGDRIRDDKEVV